MSDGTGAARRRGTLIVLSAPSGTGKTTLVRRLRERVPGLSVSVSTTTRAPRPGEREGADYHFVTREEFLRRVEAGEFLEHADVHGNLYGTQRELVEPLLAEGTDVLLEIDVQGARQVARATPDARLVFILPPSREELERRLRGRGLDAPDVIERRLANAAREVAAALEYHHVVVNEDLGRALEDLVTIVLSYRQATAAQRPRVEDIQRTFGILPEART